MSDSTMSENSAAAAAPVWLSPASYWQPPLYTVTAWLEHAPFAYWLVDALRPRMVVELGTHYGFSYFVFCEAIKRLGLDTAAFALDSWEGDDHAGKYGEEVYEFVSEINSAHYPGFSTLQRGYFDDSLDRFEDGSIDLLHIDGRHGYEDVKHDFHSWLPKMSRRGVVILHDIAEHQEGFGVWQFWDELQSVYPSFAFGHAHGLGVLGVGPDQADTLKRFFLEAASQGDNIRRSYEELGGALVNISKLEALAEENLALRSEVSEIRKQLDQSRRDRDVAIAESSAELERISNSKSWRFTAPARKLGSSLHRRRK